MAHGRWTSFLCHGMAGHRLEECTGYSRVNRALVNSVNTVLNNLQVCTTCPPTSRKLFIRCLSIPCQKGQSTYLGRIHAACLERAGYSRRRSRTSTSTYMARWVKRCSEVRFELSHMAQAPTRRYTVPCLQGILCVQNIPRSRTDPVLQLNRVLPSSPLAILCTPYRYYTAVLLSSLGPLHQYPVHGAAGC